MNPGSMVLAHITGMLEGAVFIFYKDLYGVLVILIGWLGLEFNALGSLEFDGLYITEGHSNC